MKKRTPPRRVSVSSDDRARIRPLAARSVEAGRRDAADGNGPMTAQGASGRSEAADGSARPMSTIAPPGRASAALLELLGHKPACAALSTKGLVASCDCTPTKLHDPAIVIGVVMHYARLAMSQRTALPTVIVELLTLHVEAGDPACIMVASWLDQSGLLDLPISVRRRRIGS